MDVHVFILGFGIFSKRGGFGDIANAVETIPKLRLRPPPFRAAKIECN